MFPLVSVIIPTYNYAHYIMQAINSVINQNYPAENIEIIVVDDGSTDNSREVLQDLIDRNVIKYYFQNNKGKANATAVAVQKCSGKYIFNLDADDYFLPEKITKFVKVFESDDSIVHVSSPATIILDGKENGHELIPGELLEQKINGQVLLSHFYHQHILYGGGSTFAARADRLKKITIHGEVDMYIDEFLILATLQEGFSYILKEPYSVWRVHGHNYSTSQSLDEKKLLRLANSSRGMLNSILQHNYPQEIKTIYLLKHKTREIYFKELLSRKSITDILKYAKFCFLSNRYSFKLLKKYTAFNRLLPTALIKIVKRN